MLGRLDQQLFLFLNSLHSPFCDQLMHTVSGRIIWIPLYLAILIFLGIKYKRKFLVILLFIIIAATLSDQASVFVKNLVHRLRPCYEPAIQGLVHLFKEECGGTYSFVSSHATNSFDVAFLSLLFIKNKWFTICIILWALIIGYSRIYLGVHYPGDVICGSLLGALIGWSMYKLYMLTDNKILQNRDYFGTRKNRPPSP